MKRSTIIELIAALLILLFMYTGVSKLIEYDKFIGTLYASPLIGKNLAHISAWSLLIIEFGISILLFFPRIRKIGLWSSLVLMIVFTSYIGYLVYVAPHKPCSCGGVIKEMTWNQHFVFNIFFTLLAAIALWLERKDRLQKNKHYIKQVIFT